jgi:putative tryptophan/tyrosine transport system substrate-binding protein
VKRRELVGGVAALAVLPAQVAAAPLPVVGFAGVASPGPFAHLVAAFQAGLAEAGFAEGKTAQVEYRWAEGKFEVFEALAKELLELPVAALAVSGGYRTVKICQDLSATTPIVFSGSGDPVKAGLIASYSRPGGNVTGVDILTSALDAKRFELLLELVPGAKRVGVLFNPNQRQMGPAEETAFRKTAEAAGREVLLVKAAGGELDQAFAAFRAAQVGGLLITADPVYYAAREKLVTLAAAARLPTVYEFREFADVGGLMSYGASLRDAYRRVGSIVGQILGGAKPAELPVARLAKFDFVINLKTAQTLGLEVPQQMLVQATEIIE